MPKQVYNPLKFYCPPNGATPDYIVYHDFKSWVAYGLLACWLSHDADDPNADCSFDRPVTKDDVQELRRIFLDLLETTIVALWTGENNPGDGEIDQRNPQHVFIDTDESGEGMLSWYVRLDGPSDDEDESDASMMFELACQGEDSHCIWLAYDAIEDRAEVLKVLREARETIGDKVWDELEKLVELADTGK